MKKYLLNLVVLCVIIFFVLLGDASQNPRIEKINMIINELISQLVMVFIGITLGLLIKNFLLTLALSFLITSLAIACIYLGIFSNFSYELIIAELIVILGFATISNLHHAQTSIIHKK